MREASLPRSPTCSLSTSPSLFALCSRRPAEEEHEKHMGAGVVEPELVARTGFFAQEKWQESFLPKLVRKRAANGAQRRSRCVYFLNLLRCNMIISSWQLSDLLKGKAVCIVRHPFP